MDLLKGFAVLSIAWTHWLRSISILPVKLDVFSLFLLETGRIGGEIFIFLSGMMLTIGLVKSQREKPSWKAWYKKRIIRLYPTFLLAIVINIAFDFFLYEDTYGLNLIFTKASGFQSIPFSSIKFWKIVSHYWYFTLILVCYILFPFFYFLIRKRFKLMILLGIVLYGFYVIFYDVFNQISQFIIYSLFRQELDLQWYSLFTPRIFVFFFGMLFGYWISHNEGEDSKSFPKSKFRLVILSLLVSLIIVISIHLYFNSFLTRLIRPGSTLYNPNDPFIEQLTRILTFPLMGILLPPLILIILSKTKGVNKIFTFPGKEAYEIFLFHDIILNINSYIIVTILGLQLWDYGYISIPLISLGCILISFPSYLFSGWIKEKKNFYPIIIIISGSLILYGIIANILILIQIPSLINFYSLILYSLILSTLILILYFRKRSNEKKNLSEIFLQGRDLLY